MKNSGRQVLCPKNRTYFSVGFVLLLLMGASAGLALCWGAAQLEPSKILSIVWGKLTDNTALLQTLKPSEVAIVWEIRLPRMLSGILVGMGLSVAGVLFQALLHNPLADPYTLGVSSGAAFGSSLALFLTIATGIKFPHVVFAFAFASLTLLVVLLIAQRGGGLLASNLIIAGIIVSSILSSGISFLKMASGENVGAIVFWLMGSLSARNWADVRLLAFLVIPACLVALLFADDLNVMVFGDSTARTMGVNTRRTRLFYLLLGSAITAACVAVSGIIGFVGLVVPHILRYWLTANNRVLIPLSALMGGLILSLADNAARLLPGADLPVGVLTTLLGGPFFIYVFITRQKR